MSRKMTTLHEDLARMGLGSDGEVSRDGKESPIQESIMDDVRKIINRNIGDIRKGLAQLSLKKAEAEKALQMLASGVAGIKACDFALDSVCGRMIENRAKGLKEASGSPACDVCGKPAVANFQKLWVKYPVDSKGGYGKPNVLDDQDPSGEENLHYCKLHAEENRPV